MKIFYTISSKKLWNFKTFYSIHLIRCTYCYQVSWTVKDVGKKTCIKFLRSLQRQNGLLLNESRVLHYTNQPMTTFIYIFFFMCSCSHALPSKYLMCLYLVSLKSHLLLWHTDIYFWQWWCFHIQLFPQPSIAIRKNGVKVITKILTRWASPNDYFLKHFHVMTHAYTCTCINYFAIMKWEITILFKMLSSKKQYVRVIPLSTWNC